MHSHSIDQWAHEHVFLGSRHDHNERRTRFVVALTAAMMVGEIAAGSAFGSMALLADGWHMATHVGALGIAALAQILDKWLPGAGESRILTPIYAFLTVIACLGLLVLPLKATLLLFGGD